MNSVGENSMFFMAPIFILAIAIEFYLHDKQREYLVKNPFNITFILEQKYV